MGEESVEVLRAGATDLILKTYLQRLIPSLQRLIPSLHRAVVESSLRAVNQNAITEVIQERTKLEMKFKERTHELHISNRKLTSEIQERKSYEKR